MIKWPNKIYNKSHFIIHISSQLLRSFNNRPNNIFKNKQWEYELALILYHH